MLAPLVESTAGGGAGGIKVMCNHEVPARPAGGRPEDQAAPNQTFCVKLRLYSCHKHQMSQYSHHLQATWMMVYGWLEWHIYNDACNINSLPIIYQNSFKKFFDCDGNSNLFEEHQFNG